MRKYNHTTIRQLLRETPDGMPVRAIVSATGISRDCVLDALRAMPDAYIDRWEPAPRCDYAAVWCVVVPPDNCPHPTGRHERNA